MMPGIGWAGGMSSTTSVLPDNLLNNAARANEGADGIGEVAVMGKRSFNRA